MKKQNLSLSPEERAAASGRIFRRVAESGPFGTARCVAFFCALPDEPATEEALARWGSARRIVVPGSGATRCGSSITYPGTPCGGLRDRRTGRGRNAVRTVRNRFDRRSWNGIYASRCPHGRGRGFYDKYLSQPGFRGVKVGVCYAHQLVGALPVEPHDVFMDYVITNG